MDLQDTAVAEGGVSLEQKPDSLDMCDLTLPPSTELASFDTSSQAIESKSESDTQDRTRGAVKCEYKQKICEKCKESTNHMICTHWVNCNDYKKNKTIKYVIVTCLRCNEERSPCQKCCKKAKKSCADAALATNVWIENEFAATKYSMACQACGQKYVRCNYCKALYKSYSGRKGQNRTKENCKHLKYMRIVKARNNNKNRKSRAREGTVSDDNQVRRPRTGPSPDSDPANTHKACSAAAAASVTPPGSQVDAYKLEFKNQADQWDTRAEHLQRRIQQLVKEFTQCKQELKHCRSESSRLKIMSL